MEKGDVNQFCLENVQWASHVVTAAYVSHLNFLL